MSERRRNGPAVPLTSARLLDVLDRMYDIETSEPDWLRGVAEAIRPVVDCGAGVSAVIYPTEDTPGTRIGLGHDIETMWAELVRVVPLEVFSDPEAIGPISNAALSTAPRFRGHAAVGHAAMRVRSLTGLNATDLSRRIVTVGVPAPLGGRVFWPKRDRSSWERVTAHLGAAFRLRNRRRVGERPAMVVDQSGRVQHVEPGVAAVDLARLREVVAAVHRARRIRMSPEAMLAAWRALHEGRWSIVESVERDGKRFLIARPNVPLPNDEPPASAESVDRPPPTQEEPSQLSPQERCALALLAEGHSNKLIAYELDVATSTVATLLARAARKLGCENRLELARAGRALKHHVTRQPRGKEPA